MIKRFLAWSYAVSAAIAAGIVLALVAIGVETTIGRGIGPAVMDKRMTPARVADANLLPAFSMPAIDQAFAETVARPLFVPTRRPAPPGAQANPNWKGKFILLGTSVTKALGDIAMLKEIATNKTFSVRSGQQINGITVDSVKPDRVTLKQGEDTEEVLMRTQGSPRLPPGTPAVPPPGAPAPGTMPLPPAPLTPPRAAAPQPGAASTAPAKIILPPNQPNTQSQPTQEEILARRRAARGQPPQ
jgi:general secretion pathway protein N